MPNQDNSGKTERFPGTMKPADSDRSPAHYFALKSFAHALCHPESSCVRRTLIPSTSPFIGLPNRSRGFSVTAFIAAVAILAWLSAPARSVTAEPEPNLETIQAAASSYAVSIRTLEGKYRLTTTPGPDFKARSGAPIMRDLTMETTFV